MNRSSEYDLKNFPWNIFNGCGMPIEDAYSSGHLVLSHYGTCKCSNVETNVSWTCLVSGLLSFEHPSVLLFLLPNVFRSLWYLCAALEFSISILKIYKSPLNCYHRVIHVYITSFLKHLEIFRSYSELLSRFGAIPYQENLPIVVWWEDLLS